MSHYRYRASIASVFTTLLYLFAIGQVHSAEPLPPPPATQKSIAPSAVLPPGSYKPKLGQTLDQVITKTMGNSPLNLAVLRQAFIRQNPAAFEAGKTPRLRKGVVLIVPDHDALLLNLMPSTAPLSRPAAVTVAGTAEVESSSPSAPAAGDERRHWVRYP